MIFRINILLFIVVALIAVNLFNLPGHGFVKWAMAQIGNITGGGNVGFMSRFAGAALNDPSTQIGNSLIFDTGTNVGIGTTSPGAKLDVAGNIRTTNGYIDLQGAAGATGLLRSHPTVAGIEIGSLSNNPIWFITNSAERMRIDAAGNVGIGTGAPSGTLSLYNINGADLTMQYGGQQLWWFSANIPGILKIGGNGATRPAVGAININGGNNNVGIGTTAPEAKLHVNGEMMLTPLAADPASLVNGMIWMRQ